MNEIFLSAISAYEIVVKAKLGKLDLDRAPKAFVLTERGERGIVPLPIDEADAFAVALLPAIHADPFDRILIAQCITGGLTLLTPDATIARYPIRVAW